MKRNPNRIQFIYDNNEGERLDIFLSVHFPEFSRSHYKTMIASGQVTVDGRRVKPGYTLSFGDEVAMEKQNPKPVDVAPEEIPLDIVYEADDIMVVNKARGMVVHPAPGHMSGTLVNAALHHADNLSGINGELRPGIVHRLDKDTTGLIIIAKNDMAHNSLSEQIENKTAMRIYTALAVGSFAEKEGVIDAPIARHKTDRKRMAVVNGGRRAVTHYTVDAEYEGYTLLTLRLETGRTHQIRVHLKHIGRPVACDPVYGPGKNNLRFDQQLLHAKTLIIDHPRTGERMTFNADLPDDFKRILAELKPKT